ncbi:MAG: hypothetical protein COA49_09400 [Bacteroidetes bacterium]|nr:MAG: hypothetical protein COA49_09400 [Bacteroidota bacterium]
MCNLKYFRVAVLLLLTSCIFNSSFSQSVLHGELVGWDSDVTELPSFLFLYKDVNGITEQCEFIDVITIDVNGRFKFTSPEAHTEVYKFESPPWSWKTLVRPGDLETNLLQLFKPKTGPTRIRGVMARSSWSSGESDVDVVHPSVKYDSLRMLASTLDDLVLYDRMLLSGAVNNGGKLVNISYLDSINTLFEDACYEVLQEKYFNEPNFYSDLVRSRRWQWRRDSGWSSEKMREVWSKEELLDKARGLSEKILSPGWCSSWVEVNGQWYSEFGDKDMLDEWIQKGENDSISEYLGCKKEEIQLAMWWWDKNMPNSLASLWLGNNDTESLSGLMNSSKGDKWSASDLKSKNWTNPSNDVVSLDELYGKWTVLMVIKDGCFSCIREWAALYYLENSIRITRTDINFTALSIDGTQQKWEKLIKERISYDQTLRWVGSDPRWMDGMYISSVPQVIILTPDLEIHSYSAPLPSQGLGEYLLKLQ